jgi:hypothetical protein
VLGGLASMVFIYYFRSSALLVSWPLLFFLSLQMIIPEILRERFVRVHYQLSLYYIMLLLLMIFFVPVVSGAIGVREFILALILCLLLWVVLLSVYVMAVKQDRVATIFRVFLACASMTVLIALAYFFNIIPAIPLALRVGEVAHAVERNTSGNYILEREPTTFIEALTSIPTYHFHEGEPVYFFSAVFAPTALTAHITHEWQRYDQTSGIWQTMTTVTFPISGGSQNGYRGYSMKYSVSEGEWRVNVKTVDGRAIGRSRFYIQKTDLPVSLAEETR